MMANAGGFQSNFPPCVIYNQPSPLQRSQTYNPPPPSYPP